MSHKESSRFFDHLMFFVAVVALAFTVLITLRVDPKFQADAVARDSMQITTKSATTFRKPERRIASDQQAVSKAFKPTTVEPSQQAQKAEVTDLVAESSRDVWHLVTLGLEVLDGGEATEQALEYFRRALQQDPTNVMAMEELVALYRAQGDAAAAISFLQAIADEQPASSALSSVLSDLLVRQGLPGEALSYLSHNDAAQGWAFAQAGEFDNSLSAYDRAINTAQDPSERADLQLTKAQVLLDAGRIEDAKDFFEQIQQQWDPQSSAYQALAAMLQHTE